MEKVLQLLIEVKNSQPFSWRRTLVPDSIFFIEFDTYLRGAIGWGMENNSRFLIDGKILEVPDDSSGEWEEDGKGDIFELCLDEFLIEKGTQFSYYLDAGEALITVEEIKAPENEGMLYRCLDGGGTYPPLLRDSEEGPLSVVRDDDEAPSENDVQVPPFDSQEVDTLLIRFGRELDQIYQEVENHINEELGNDLDSEEINETLDEPPEEEFPPEYRFIKEFPSHQYLLDSEAEREELKYMVEKAIGMDESLEQVNYFRLLEEGYKEEEIKSLICEAVAVERYGEYRYGTSLIIDRFQFNLERLPKPPLEVPDTSIAIQLLERADRGFPFWAIEILMDSPKAREKVVQSIKNITLHEYMWEDNIAAPIWFATAAEGHICEELIDPVIDIFRYENILESDLLNEQAEYLLMLLTEKYPDQVIPKVLDITRRKFRRKDLSRIHYLYDVLFFADPEKYKEPILDILKDPETPAHDFWAHMVSYLQIKEAEPVLKEIIQKAQKEEPENKERKDRRFSNIIEYEEALKELKEGDPLYPDLMQPLTKTREDWKTYYQKWEHLFYDHAYLEEEADHLENSGTGSSPHPFAQENGQIIKPKKPQRNDPCYCGSGKKYKKCCLPRDRENGEI